MEETARPKETSRSHQPDQQLIKDTIQTFVELVLIQKFADMPGWLDFDLTVSQVRAIYFLFAHEQLTISGLARMLEIGTPATSILVQQLVERQLVERSEDPRDRRRSWVRLTTRGGELVSGRREQREINFRRWLGQMDEEDVSCLLQGASALLEVVRSAQP